VVEVPDDGEVVEVCTPTAARRPAPLLSQQQEAQLVSTLPGAGAAAHSGTAHLVGLPPAAASVEGIADIGSWVMLKASFSDVTHPSNASSLKAWRNKHEQDALFFAVQRQDDAVLDICRYCVETLGLSVHHRDVLQQTAFFWAASKGTAKVVRYLKEKGAMSQCLDQYGRQPLFYAAKSANVSTVVQLLEQRADPSHSDSSKQTPVFAACSADTSANLAVLHKLLVAGASFDDKDVKGGTALTYAVTSVFPGACRRLLEAGANPGEAAKLASKLKAQGRKGSIAVLDAFSGRQSFA